MEGDMGIYRKESIIGCKGKYLHNGWVSWEDVLDLFFGDVLNKKYREGYEAGFQEGRYPPKMEFAFTRDDAPVW
jgi:hypothetical protein